MEKTRELAEHIYAQEVDGNQDVALAMIDAQAEIDALPDSMVGISEMQEYGYTWIEMLPLRRNWKNQKIHIGRCRMMNKFTVEEINFMCVFETQNRMKMMEEIRRVMPHIKDSDMEDIAGQVLEKLEGMNDKEFAELVLEAAE